MTLSDFISLASLASLVYFAYGTWRIDAKLGKTNEFLERQNRTLERIEHSIDSLKNNAADISSTLNDWPHVR